MKSLYLLSATFTFLLGCGGSDGTVGDGGGSDSTTNNPDSSMMNKDSGGSDSAMNMDSQSMDSAMNDSSMNDSSVMDAGLSCTTPAQCMNQQVCCGTLSLGAGQFPQCMVNGYGATCKTAQSCPTTFQFMCNSMQQVRGCSNNSHCTEQQYSQCCTFTVNMQSVSFCANNIIAQAGGGTCQ